MSNVTYTVSRFVWNEGVSFNTNVGNIFRLEVLMTDIVTETSAKEFVSKLKEIEKLYTDSDRCSEYQITPRLVSRCHCGLGENAPQKPIGDVR